MKSVEKIEIVICKFILLKMCIHDALIKIISKDDLDTFIKIMDEYGDYNFNECNCVVISKCPKLFSLRNSGETNAVEILKYILKCNPDFKKECKYETLHSAIRHGHKKIVELLLINNTNPNLDTIFDTALNVAIQKGDIEIIELLLKFKADPNKFYPHRPGPLFLAVNNLRREIIELLLNYKANPNKEDESGIIPLFLAIEKNNIPIIELLLKHNSNPNKEKNFKYTPLHVAVSNNRKEIVELLLNYKADPNKENFYKNTPLHIAADKGNEEIFNILYQVTDQRYKNDIPILRYTKFLKIKKILEISTKTQSIFILQSYEFDDTSLLSRDYICRDLVFLILKHLKKEKRLLKYKNMIEN